MTRNSNGKSRDGSAPVPIAALETGTEFDGILAKANQAKPVCPHFGTCGGCQFQHVSDDYLANWKADQVTSALANVGIEAKLRRLHCSPDRSRRRATLAARRTKKTVLLGYHAKGSDQIVDIATCPLVVPAIEASLPALRDLTRMAATRSRPIKYHVTQTENGLDLVIADAREFRPENAADISKLPFARITWNGDLVAMETPPIVRFDGIPVELPPGAFLQATRHGEAALTDAVREAVGNARQIADLFCGCGTFALPLSRHASITAMDAQGDMIAALDTAWRRADSLRAITGERRDLFRRPLLASELSRFEAIVLDPPRAGASAQVAEIARSDVPVVAYVSCNPATFARDAAVLTRSGYRLDWLDVVDQFRWSPHTELAARFVHDPAAR